MNYERDLTYWRKSRQKRRLSINAIAARLTEELGYPITYDHLANWEYGKSKNPSVPVWKAIERQIQEWRREDSRVREKKSHTYGADYVCQTCGERVPGPAVGADYCMRCGMYFGCRTCPSCGHVENRPGSEFCVKCGAGLTT